MHKVKKDCFVALLLAMTLFLFVPSMVHASVAGEVNKANDLYKQGKFDDSLDLYQEALGQDDKSPVVQYDLGTALYKKGDYAKALGYLEQAAQDKNIKIKPKAEYNLGNVLYKSGIQKENTDVNVAIKSLQEALGHYGQSISADPKDQDAVFNQDFVKKEIERLKQKKQQQQNQQNQQSQQNQQNQQNQKQQQNQKNQQSQQNQQNQQSQQNQQKQEPSHTEDSYKSQQENQQKNSKDQQNQQSGSKEQQEKNALDQAEQNQKELDRKQAEDLLEDYRENEEPKKLLSYMPKKIDDRPVIKDW